MLNRLLFRFSGRLPCRIIQVREAPYLERYYLGRLFGATFYLHRFVSPDSEEHLHNHPWGWGASLILCGNYLEERLVDICPAVPGSGGLTRKVRRRFFNPVMGNTFHRIGAAKPGTWTLFAHGERQKLPQGGLKGWGFLSNPRVHPGEAPSATVFTQYPPATHLLWWLAAPLGKHSPRAPL